MPPDINPNDPNQLPGQVIVPTNGPAINAPDTTPPLQPAVSTLTQTTEPQPVIYAAPNNQSSSKKKFYLLGVGVLVLALVSGGIVYGIKSTNKPKAKPVVTSTSKTEVANNSLSQNIPTNNAATKSSSAKSSTSTTASPTSQATPTVSAETVAISFIKSLQSEDKTKADSLETAKLKAYLKDTAQTESYYELCKNDTSCALYKWFDLSKATKSQADELLPDGSPVTAVTLSVTTVINSATSKNSVTISLSPSGNTWLVEDVSQSFDGSSN